MRLFSDNLIGVFKVDGITNALAISRGFLGEGKAVASQNGEIRSVIVKDNAGIIGVYFSNLSSEMVNTHFTRQGFIFI